MRAFDGSIAAPRSPLADTHPAVKLCAALGTVVAISVLPSEAGWRFPAVLAALAALALGARVPLRFLLRRCLVATPFIALAAAMPLVSVATGGAEIAAAVAWKAFSAVVVLSLLAATTPIEHVVESLRRLGAPSGLALTAILMHRYLFVLLDEWRSIDRARECRTGGRVNSGRARIWANQAAMVFVRGWERADRVAQAMVARGFQGEFPRLTATRPGTREIALGAALPLLVLALRIL